MTKVNNFIFDLGGVLLDINFERVKKSFEELGIPQFNEQYSQLQASDLFEKLETGAISETDFYNTINAQVNNNIPQYKIQTAWNSILEKFRVGSLSFLEKLRSDHRVFLLSNTNSIHLAEINKILIQQTGITQLDHYFEKAYYSHHVGMRKPNADIYKYVIEDAQIDPKNTVFIDDTSINVEAASHLGFQTHLLLKGETIESLKYFN